MVKKVSTHRGFNYHQLSPDYSFLRSLALAHPTLIGMTERMKQDKKVRVEKQKGGGMKEGEWMGESGE